MNSPSPWKSIWDKKERKYAIYSEEDWIADVRFNDDANLIAAAPEMYEALKMQYCVQCKGMIGLPKKHEFECSCDQARAALAKAEGKK